MLKIILLAKQYKILRYEDVSMKFKKHNIFWRSGPTYLQLMYISVQMSNPPK